MIQQFKFCKPGLGLSWLMVVLVLVGSLLGGALTAVWPATPQSLSYLITMCFPLAASWWIGAQTMLRGEGALAIDAPHFEKLGAPLYLGLAAVAMLTLSIVIEPTTSFIPMPDSIKAIFEKAFMDSALWDMIVSTCILAPLLEEFLCRGMMLRGMLARGKAPWKAIFWSALVFAVMHMNPWQSIPAFIMGLLLGWVYWRTHSLWASIFLHCLNNATATLISRVWTDLPIDAGLRDVLPENIYWTVYVAAALLLVISLVILNEKTISPQVQSHLDA